MRRPAEFLQRLGWVLLAITAFPFLIFGVTAMMFGLSLSDFPVGLPGGPDAVRVSTGVGWAEVVAGNPTAMTLLRGVSRTAGLALLGFGVLVIVVAVVPYRRGQRWAWLTLWVVPVTMIGLLFHEWEGDFAHMPAMFLLLSLAGLVLPYRVFFPKQRDPLTPSVGQPGG